MKFRPYDAARWLLLVLGLGLVAHGAYALHQRNAEDAARDRIYSRVLDTITQDEMARALALAKEFIATAPDEDPRLPQVVSFAHEAAAREALRLARDGDIDAARRLLLALDEFGPDNPRSPSRQADEP